MEKKRNIFQKIADFFVKLFLAIISLFKKEKKDDKKELETFEDNIQNNVINLRDSNNIPLPDTQSTKNFPDYLSSTSDSTDNRDKTLKMYKDFVKDKDLNIYQKLYLIFDEDHIKEIIEDILKEDYEIDAKKTKQVIKDNIEKLEEKLLEDVKYKIEHKDIETEEVLKDYLKEEIKKEVKEHPLDKVEPPKKYVMATNKPEKKIQPKEEKLPKVTQEKIIKDIPKRIKPRVIEKAKETKIAMIKTKEPAIVKPKDHLFVAASAATVMAAGVAVDLVTPLKKNDLPKTKIIPNKKVELPKEIKKDEPSIQKEETKVELKPLEKDLETKQTINTPPPVKEEVKVETKEEETQELILEKNIKEEKQKTHEVIETKIKEFEYVDDHKDEIKENEIAQINKERLVKEDKKITEELKQIEKEIEVLKEEKAKEEKEEIKEQPKEEIKKEELKKEEPKKEEPKKEEPKKEEEKRAPVPGENAVLSQKVIPDISRYRPVRNWSLTKQNVHFLISKATQGTTHVDPTLREFINNCEKYKIPYWVYTFLEAGDELEQARFMVDTCRPYVGKYFCGYILDVEAEYVKPYKANDPEDIAEALNYLKKTGKKAMVYINYSRYDMYKDIIDNRGDRVAWWEARYGKNNGLYEPDKYPSHEGCDLHQYTSKGSCPGIAVYDGTYGLDLNRLNGNKSLKWFMTP